MMSEHPSYPQMPVHKKSQTPFPPEIIRAVLDAIANQGVTIRDLSDLLDIPADTIRSWAKVGAVRPRRIMSEAELDESVQLCLNSGKNALREKLGGKLNVQFNTTLNYRELTDTQLTFIDVGFHQTDAAPVTHSPEETAAFGGVIACVDRQLKYIEQTSQKAETIQEVTAALSAAVALKQLKEAFLDPPRCDNWRDIKVVVDIAREALGMNLKIKESVQRTGVDIGVLGFNPKPATEPAKFVKGNKVRTVDLDVEAANMPLKD
jgi:hypothetical protein